MTQALIAWFLTNIVVPLAATFLIAVLTKVALAINKKYNLDIQQKTIENAVRYVEQMAETAIKNGSTVQAPTQKMDSAVQYVNKVIPGLDQDHLEKRIEATVHSLKDNHMGAGKS